MRPTGRAAIGSILVLYLALGARFAVLTPLWQAPDEPAHFNYIAQIAGDSLRPPKVEAGDYPHDRLETLKATHFPAESDIDGIEYEDHQPPAYYYLARPFFLAAGHRSARVYSIRLFGLLLGLVTISLSWRIARGFEPEDKLLALSTAAFVAFLPMHVSMHAAVSNDPLAYLIAAAALALALARLDGRVGRRRLVVLGGMLLGLAVLTKLTIIAPVALMLSAAEALFWWNDGRRATQASFASISGLLILGLAIALPWLLRNAAVYGGHDWFGLQAHAQVVACDALGACQPSTADWLAQHGPAALALRFASFTFKSFWGVFGWMGVFLDRLAGVPIYPALALASALAALGLIDYLRKLFGVEGNRRKRNQCVVMAIGVIATAGGFLAYNLSFVQHQGRYLFPALVPIALAYCAGLREIGRFIGRRSDPSPDRARTMGNSLMLGFVLALAGLAWISLHRYILPGLS